MAKAAVDLKTIQAMKSPDAEERQNIHLETPAVSSDGEYYTLRIPTRIVRQQIGMSSTGKSLIAHARTDGKESFTFVVLDDNGEAITTLDCPAFALNLTLRG